MRSIPVALFWETFRRGRWSLLTFGLAANVFPILLYSALGHDGALDPADSNQIAMHVVFEQIYPFCFGVAVLAALGAPARLYALPIRTSTLVLLQMLQAMLIVAVEMLASAVVLNAIFGLRWPLWGPVLFGAVAVAVIQAMLWLADRSAWLAVAIAVPGGALGLWFKAHYGPAFSQPTHYWDVVTPLDVAMLALITAAAYCVAVVGVARNRRGEAPLSIGFVDWVCRVFSASSGRDVAFRTPAEAQFWFEWRRKGWSMPAIVIVGLVYGLGSWLAASRAAEDLFKGFVAGGAIFAVTTFMTGIVMGQTGARDMRIGPFLATRPMTTTDMARAILKCTGKSVLIGWSIWAASFLAVTAMLKAIGVGFSLQLAEPLGWWYVPAILVGAWAGCGLLGPLALTGRQWLVGGVVFGSVSLLIGLLLFSKFALTREGQEQFFRWGLAVLAMLLITGTGAAFATAHRRSLIGMAVILTAASAWAVVSAVVVAGLFSVSSDALVVSFCAVGILALAVSPLATAPLALAWNRTR
jgi:hypothetical protein